MNQTAWLPLAIVLTSLVASVLIFLLPEHARPWRIAINLTAAVAKVVLVGMLFAGVAAGRQYIFAVPLLPDIQLKLHADPFSLMLVGLSAGLWLLTTIYAIAYLEGSPNRGRFFGFFSLCVAATVGVAMAGNLITFLIFYELLTLTTWPLVVHRGTDKALAAGRVYLAYTFTGGAMVLIGLAWLTTIVGPVGFAPRGVLAGLDPVHHPALRLIFVLLVLGFGVKAALVPLHGWLPRAMVAPAPVSALLHAVAVVKAGAFGIVRVVYDVYGVEFAGDLGVLHWLTVAAAVTIVYGSVRALAQDDLKRRLAFSTVSQVSYIALGVAVFGPLSSIGGIVHLVHQGLMKITLFFCAGNYAESLGIHKVSEMHGVGRRMPWTTAAFTVGALGMIGVPPVAGFVSKWYLGMGAMEAGQPWVLAVLLASSALNAGYFLPILYVAWFCEPRGEWPHEHSFGRWETAAGLLLPTVATAALALAAGLFAGSPWSPLAWARLIMTREYGP